MAVQGKHDVITIVAANDFRVNDTLWKAVDVGGEFTSANDAGAIGLAASRANSGEHLSVAYAGKLKGWAGAAISVGVPVQVVASGYLITAVSGTNIVGRALEAANSGDLFSGLFAFGAQSTLA